MFEEQECSPDYITIINIYNQKVVAAGDDQLAEPALPFLSYNNILQDKLMKKSRKYCFLQ